MNTDRPKGVGNAYRFDQSKESGFDRFRLVVQSGTRAFMSWTAVCRLFLLVLRVSFTLRVRGLRGVILGGLV